MVEDDVAAVRQFYDEKGFFDTRVGRKLIWSPDLSELQIDFLVEEGVRYTVDQVTFVGAESVTDAQLRKNLKLTEGRPYDYELVQRDVREIVRVYSPHGFIYQPQSRDRDFLTIDPKPNFKRVAGHVELIYNIHEGKPFILGRIIPRGNAKTQDKVILREMRMSPGQLYNSGYVQDAVERLRGLRYFKRVTATPIGNDPTTRDLLVEVEEDRTAEIQFGAGINSNGGIGGNLSYEQRNFDIANPPSNWNDLSEKAWVGAGQNFRVSLDPGTRFTNASIRFTDPYIFDQPYIFSGELYLSNRIREDYDDRRVGGRVSLGKRFNDIWTGVVSLRAEDVEVRDINDPEIRADEILALEGHNALTSAGLTVRRDTTTRGILPDRGMTTAAGVEVFGALGGDFDFQKYTLSHDQYFTLREDLLDRKVILALHGDVGYMTHEAPVVERYYGGGIGSIRGFAFRGVSPRAGPANDRVGGDFRVIGSAEVSFPVYGEELRGVFFSDAGTVEPDVRIGTIRSSVGVGVRLTIPQLHIQVPIALDFAIPITKAPEDDTQIFSFSLGFSR
jgi:outer membrane protein assembly factor BamA